MIRPTLAVLPARARAVSVADYVTRALASTFARAEAVVQRDGCWAVHYLGPTVGTLPSVARQATVAALIVDDCAHGTDRAPEVFVAVRGGGHAEEYAPPARRTVAGGVR